MHSQVKTTKTIAIIIPHFKTLELTRICLRMLRQNTELKHCEVIVIDNGSGDGSGDQLAMIPWIRLLRREPPPEERPARAHGLALNLGVRATAAPIILTLHTDTMILRPDWLEYMLGVLDLGGPRCGIVGCWKMEAESFWRRTGKGIENWVRGLRGRRQERPRYVRSYCALYRRDVLSVYPAMFDPGGDQSAGEALFAAAIRSGWTCQLVASESLSRYVWHLNHATMALNREFGRCDRYMPRTRARAIRRIDQFFGSINAERILREPMINT